MLIRPFLITWSKTTHAAPVRLVNLYKVFNTFTRGLIRSSRIIFAQGPLWMNLGSFISQVAFICSGHQKLSHLACFYITHTTSGDCSTGSCMCGRQRKNKKGNPYVVAVHHKLCGLSMSSKGCMVYYCMSILQHNLSALLSIPPPSGLVFRVLHWGFH